MNDLERFNTIKANRLCYNCFQGDHFISKCKSKNTCFKNDCSAKHHTTPHEYFTSNQRDRNKKTRKEDLKQNSNIKGEEDKIQSLQT